MVFIDYRNDEKIWAGLRAKGKKKARLEIATRMLEKGYAPEEISSITDLTLDIIEKIAAQKKAN